jgi:23S rRNA G2445 N2-methylase RlmL
MTGSGSFLVEGAMIAADIAPGLIHIKCNVVGSTKPPIIRWKHNYYTSDELNQLWKSAVLDATTRAKQGIQQLQRDSPKRIYIIGNDLHNGTLYLAERALNLESFWIAFHC